MTVISKYLFYQIRYLSLRLSSTNLKKLSLHERLNVLRKMSPKHRESPIITKLDTPAFKSIFTDELNSFVSLFRKHNYEIRIAGGAVRDLLMGLSPKDLDFATTATPDDMKQMFELENIRMINAKGEKHGTITARINDKENFEVTTLRIDVVTDGRHAEVQYTTDWFLDANRRDLTINSMFLGLDGSVYDYFYGYEDLQKHRVAFVGDPSLRIQEDYLRILRYFRFYGRIAKTADGHEEITLEAIRKHASGLQNISGERIWMELKKILEGNFACELLMTIIECGIPSHIGLPQVLNIEELKRVWKTCKNHKLHAITLLSTLLRSQEDVAALNSRLKLSAFERDLASFIIEHREPKISANPLIPLLPYKQVVVKSKAKLSHTIEWVTETLNFWFNFERAWHSRR
ncbi:Poly A polymerase head domain [Popillia japonica]|uniref:Poly A polymerase head domain n=1 Tax=Popillia japonica TaxID=7064 RepID=A0AAW1KS65_POPJA